MELIDPAGAREFLETIVAAFSVLGGAMAYRSGYAAAQARAQNQAPHVLAHEINEGIAEGFTWGSQAALVALIIMVWS